MTNAGFAECAGLAGNTGSPTAFTYLANGSDSTAHSATQTALVSENSGNGLDIVVATIARTTTTVTNDTLRLTTTWSVSGSATIKEVGVFNAASSGDMLARSVTAATRTVSSGDSYAVTYDIQFS